MNEITASEDLENSLPSEAFLVNEEVNAWLQEQTDKEVQRLQQSNIKPLVLPVKNMSIVVDFTQPTKPTAVHRLEVRTNFNFDLIREIMVSDPVPCPKKEGWAFVHVVAFSDKPIPLLIPYLYPLDIRTTETSLEVRNRLNDWQFLNEKGQKSRHLIKAFRQN